MKTKVNRTQLLNSLELASPGLSPREIIEQSSCFVFDGTTVKTYNDEVSCSVDCNFPVSGAIQATSMMDILRKLNEDEIGVEDKGAEVVVYGKSRRLGLRKEQEILLPVASVDSPGEWSELPTKFVDAVRLVLSCVSKDESQFALTCVHLHPKWLEACDNFQLTRYKMPMPGLGEPTLVRGTSIKAVADMAFTRMSLSDNWIHFTTDDTGVVLSCRRYVEVYPPLEGILKCSGSALTLPKGLGEAAEKAGVFAGDAIEGSQVRVQLEANQVRIRGQGATGWYEERKQVTYRGPEMAFLIGPEVLAEIVKNHSECIVDTESNRMAITGSKFRFVTCLGKVG
mgnify:CR=1 FL=1